MKTVKTESLNIHLTGGPCLFVDAAVRGLLSFGAAILCNGGDSSEEKALTFFDMFHLRIEKVRLRATFVTFLYVVFLSTCTLLGLFFTPERSGIVLNNFERVSSLGFNLFHHLIYGSNLLFLVIIYLPWCAIWNLGLVISILEGICGIKALGSAAYLSLRNTQNGVGLVLIFIIWELGLRALCLYFGCYKTWFGIIGLISLLCLGNSLKWASFVVYFQDCIWRVSKKKTGEEQVKSGYNLAIGGANLQPSSSNEVMAAWWSSYWAIKIPKKILHFGWKGFHEILPSFRGLFRRQSSSHSNCPICGFGNDTNVHAIFWCSFSQVIWKEMSFPFLASPKEDLTFKGVLLYASEILEKEDFEKVLISAWTIWFERNKKSHGRTIRTPHQIKIWISSYYNEICRERNKTKKGVSTGCTSEQSNTETEVNSYKLYVDAAISTPKNVIGFGEVIFSSDKQMKTVLSKPLQVYVFKFTYEVRDNNI
ncbi:hypothetical protein G4B88_010975 [Cannabis sativa]|uniref:Reverse transcriptase zinc-binding domain-containing protein n=1 Tax=Cannabis sativa TaxID=3483 RepID=A0A7J6HKJ2_CANSA|nr:hypothetical protein G4B88_010975 [Cannabis sativa]